MSWSEYEAEYSDGYEAGLSEGEERAQPVIDSLERECQRLADALAFALSFVPPWAKDVPEGLDATFYGTLTMEGDLQVAEEVIRVTDLLRAYREKANA